MLQGMGVEVVSAPMFNHFSPDYLAFVTVLMIYEIVFYAFAILTTSVFGNRF